MCLALLKLRARLFVSFVLGKGMFAGNSGEGNLENVSSLQSRNSYTKGAEFYEDVIIRPWRLVFELCASAKSFSLISRQVFNIQCPAFKSVTTVI